MWKREEIAPKEQFLLFSTLFSAYLYFQESHYIFVCEIGLFDLSFFLNSANLICRDTDISKYFRGSLGLRDNESRLYFISFGSIGPFVENGVQLMYTLEGVSSVANFIHFLIRSVFFVSKGNLFDVYSFLFYFWSRVYKFFSCSTQLSMKFSLLINMKMPTIVGIFIFIKREMFMLSNV